MPNEPPKQGFYNSIKAVKKVMAAVEKNVSHFGSRDTVARRGATAPTARGFGGSWKGV